MESLLNFAENHPYWTTLWLFLICDTVSVIGRRIIKIIYKSGEKNVD